MSQEIVGYCQFGSLYVFCPSCEELKRILRDLNINPSVYHISTTLSICIELSDLTSELVIDDVIRDCYNIPIDHTIHTRLQYPSKLTAAVFFTP